MTVLKPGDEQDKKGLDAARQKLIGSDAAPFDVQKVLAENRIRKEHEKHHRKEVKDKLEHELEAARLRGSQRRIRELETELRKKDNKQSHEVEVVRHALDEEKARLNMAIKRRPDPETPRE